MRLGAHIAQTDERNTDAVITNLLGVSIEKRFVPSIANTVGTDLSKYKVVNPGEFAYGPVTSRNGDKVSIARLKGEKCIISSSYTSFKVVGDELSPDYLMLWFMRPEFDRYARFKSHGSAREIFDWEQLCEVDLPIPSLDKQKKIVDSYAAIENRIAALQRLNDKLAAYCRNYFELQCQIHPEWDEKRIDEICQVKGGKRLPAGEDLVFKTTSHPYIRVRDLNNALYLTLSKDMAFISDDVHDRISRYTVNAGDVVVSIVGTIGLTAIVDESLNLANLTENCNKLTNFIQASSHWVYLFLNSHRGKDAIRQATVGAVQAKLPLKNIQAMTLPVPREGDMRIIEETCSPFFALMSANQRELVSLEALKANLLDHLA